MEFIRCVKCGGNLELDVFKRKDEVVEGILYCLKCDATYPIISSIPVLLADLSSYFSIRSKLGGYFLTTVKNHKIKSLIRKSLRDIKYVGDDMTDLEKNWVRIYKNSKGKSFEKYVQNILKIVPRCDFVIEHGCSIGMISEILAKNHDKVFGIDKSFFALVEAKKCKIIHSDFILSDSLSNPFGNKKFDLSVALNVLELIEPLDLLKIISNQTRNFVILSDPYDYDRGKNSVKVRLDAYSLRYHLNNMGFKFLNNTNKPSFVPWKLFVNDRLELNYKVDVILGKKFKPIDNRYA